MTGNIVLIDLVENDLPQVSQAESIECKRNGSISTTDRPDFYRTNVFKLKHSYCSKQLTSLFLDAIASLDWGYEIE